MLLIPEPEKGKGFGVSKLWLDRDIVTLMAILDVQVGKGMKCHTAQQISVAYKYLFTSQKKI